MRACACYLLRTQQRNDGSLSLEQASPPHPPAHPRSSVDCKLDHGTSRLRQNVCASVEAQASRTSNEFHACFNLFSHLSTTAASALVKAIKDKGGIWYLRARMGKQRRYILLHSEQRKFKTCATQAAPTHNFKTPYPVNNPRISASVFGLHSAYSTCKKWDKNNLFRATPWLCKADFQPSGEPCGTCY